MKQISQIRNRVAPALAVWACLAAVSAQAQMAEAATAPMPMAKASMPAAPVDMAAMKQSMRMSPDAMQSMPMSGDTDKDFAMMMKMHHQQGVQMAEMQIKNGKSAEMKTMAKHIVAAQNKEIAQFDKWMAKQK